MNFNVTGHLRDKNGIWHMVLNYTDADGSRKTPSKTTGLPVKGNKKKAEAMLSEARRDLEKVLRENAERKDVNRILFSDFMLDWLKMTKPNVEVITYSSYQYSVEKVIVPYFKQRKIKLKDLKAKDIQDFYSEQASRVKNTTIIHYHANIHKALKHAVKMGMIVSNPADQVERPKKEVFHGSFYSSDEVYALFLAARGHWLELAVMFGAFYGLRRSEIVGLKWDAIDFQNNTFTIKHTVTSATVDGKKVTVAKDRAKTKSSMRTLPLVPAFREVLLEKKEKIKHYKELCGKAYLREFLDYIYVDEFGKRIDPDNITRIFPKFLKSHNLRKIRFHDLRHSCASLLLAGGVSMKEIQEWLGHSDFATTANVYSHLDYSAKLSSANAMLNGLNLTKEKATSE